VTPSVEAWARWAVPKASLTYRSALEASCSTMPKQRRNIAIGLTSKGHNRHDQSGFVTEKIISAHCWGNNLLEYKHSLQCDKLVRAAQGATCATFRTAIPTFHPVRCKGAVHIELYTNVPWGFLLENNKLNRLNTSNMEGSPVHKCGARQS
jgi:hypothetical protein